jgi:hypothetical protein
VWNLIPRECFRYLMCDPFCCWICCDVDPDEVSAAYSNGRRSQWSGRRTNPWRRFPARDYAGRCPISSTANCSSSGLKSRNRESPNTWSSDVGRQVRDGAPFWATTRRTLPPWTCSLSLPLASICIADMCVATSDVRYGPEADIALLFTPPLRPAASAASAARNEPFPCREFLLDCDAVHTCFD